MSVETKLIPGAKQYSNFGLKNMADVAMRGIIYVETEYPQELERKNSFVEQSKEEQKTEPDTTEQMELEMEG